MIMARAKRCPFCGHKLDAEGWCRNEKCADYIRTQTHDTEKAAEAGKATADGDSGQSDTDK